MAKKTNSYGEQTEQQLKNQLQENRQKLYEKRFQKAAGKLEKTHEIKNIRKEIARILTFLGKTSKEVRA